MSTTDVILLAGPTASGKSRLALDLARRHEAVIVNADAMQVYDALRVVTARPSVEDEAAAAHRLYGHVAAARRYSVGQWLDDVAPVLSEARRDGRRAIVVGGTGLYFKALTEGLASVPPIPPEVRARLKAETGAIETAELHARLGGRDRQAAERLRPSDRSRILRALEVIEATGKPLAVWQKAAAAPPLVPPAEAVRLVLAPERGWLHRQIETRAARVAGAEGLGEVAALLALGLDPELPAMKAIGVRELGDHLAGGRSLDEAIATIATETRRYAKRQATWFRHQMADWQRVTDPAALDLASPDA